MLLNEKMQRAVQAIKANALTYDFHASPMLGATLEALYLGIKELTVIEFGVATGRGLINICEIADFLTEHFEIRFRIYGFDTGHGLPQPKDFRDHPEIWAEGQYPMSDFESLKAELPSNCELILGEISDTIADFSATKLSADAPLAFIKIDVDLYSSTLASLNVLKQSPACYLPVVFSYFDDTEFWITYNRWCGERGAIEAFNAMNEFRKIDKMNVRLFDSPRQHWHDKIYGFHILDHPLRNGLKVPHQLQINTATDF